jgi:hypothetical protein
VSGVAIALKHDGGRRDAARFLLRFALTIPESCQFSDKNTVDWLSMNAC